MGWEPKVTGRMIFIQNTLEFTFAIFCAIPNIFHRVYKEERALWAVRFTPFRYFLGNAFRDVSVVTDSFERDTLA